LEEQITIGASGTTHENETGAAGAIFAKARPSRQTQP